MAPSSHVLVEPFDELPRARAIVGIHLQPGIDERTDQPSPNCALMVRGITRAQVAVVARLVIRMAGRERSQPDGCQQALLRDTRRRAPTGTDPARDASERSRATDSAGRPHRRRRLRVSTTSYRYRAFLIPESLVERRAYAFGMLCRVGRVSDPALACHRSQASSSRSALYQSALISTAFPRRGVTTQSSTLASIQVS